MNYVREHGIISLSQQNYISSMAERFQLPHYERATTPIKTDYYSQLELQLNEPVLDDVPYKELVGSLIFCMVCTRPDVAFTVSCLTSYFSSPRRIHWETAIRCLGYLFATKDLGLILGAGGSDKLVCFSDSDWASNPVTRRSIGGHVLFFGDSILSWTSKTQKGIIALSTTESEFIQMALAIRCVLYIQPTFLDIGFQNIHQVSVVFGDNKPAICSIGNESAKSRTKHLDV